MESAVESMTPGLQALQICGSIYFPRLFSTCNGQQSVYVTAGIHPDCDTAVRAAIYHIDRPGFSASHSDVITGGNSGI